jgi:hypothetical protein
MTCAEQSENNQKKEQKEARKAHKKARKESRDPGKYEAGGKLSKFIGNLQCSRNMSKFVLSRHNGSERSVSVSEAGSRK